MTSTALPVKEFKILLIGDVRVGKTSFLTRYTRNVMNKAEKPTVGVEYITKNLVLQDGTVAKVKLWDTAGSEKYKALTTAHYRGSQGALLFFDLTDRSTFQHLTSWLEAIDDHAGADTVVMAIGNKYDLVKENPGDRQITTQEAEDFARKCEILYNETSAKTGHNVKEAFESLIEVIHENQKKHAGDDRRKNQEEQMKIKLRKNFGADETEEGQQVEKKQDSCCN